MQRKWGGGGGVGRDVNDNTFVVVTKLDATEIHPLIDHGHRDFGENRVERKQKWAGLKDDNPRNKSLHLIGLQTNKVKTALSLFDSIHTLDSKNTC